MIEVSPDLKVTQPTVTLISNTLKTKAKTVKITGDKLLLKYIESEEIGIKGLIYSLEYID